MTEAELVQFLRDNLTLEVSGGGFTDPNSRRILLSINGEEITRAYFDVVQSEEYEG